MGPGELCAVSCDAWLSVLERRSEMRRAGEAGAGRTGRMLKEQGGRESGLRGGGGAVDAGCGIPQRPVSSPREKKVIHTHTRARVRMHTHTSYHIIFSAPCTYKACLWC